MDDTKPAAPPTPTKNEPNEASRETPPRNAPTITNIRTPASLERAALEMAQRTMLVQRPAPPRPADAPPRATPKPPPRPPGPVEFAFVDQYESINPLWQTQSMAIEPAQPGTMPAAIRQPFDDHFRLTLTKLQTALLASAVFALVLVAAGMAANAWLAAQDWGCRTGLTTDCSSTIPRPIARPEFPS